MLELFIGLAVVGLLAAAYALGYREGQEMYEIDRMAAKRQDNERGTA